MKNRLHLILAATAALFLAACSASFPATDCDPVPDPQPDPELSASFEAVAVPTPADPWPGTPNPLDTPATHFVRPASMGTFGPHSEHYRVGE